MAKQPRRIVLSVYPDLGRSAAVTALLASLGSGWRHLLISGQAAANLLYASELLRAAIGNAADHVRAGRRLVQHEHFCRAVDAALGRRLAPDSRYLVLAPSLVLLDAAKDARGRPLGDTCQISHLMTGERQPRRIDVERALIPMHRPAASYALVCPMAMDRALPRNQQDIVTVALGLEHQMPVELWLQPSFERARQAFRAKHVAWLHLDTHGDADGRSIMLGPSRDGGHYIDADALPRVVRPPLIVVCGCALNGNSHSIGPALQRRGALSVFGPCTTFQSLGVANSEEGEAHWYRSFFMAMAAGNDVGTSLMQTRLAVRGGLLKYAWVIVGSSQLCFPSRPDSPTASLPVDPPGGGRTDPARPSPDCTS